MAGGLNLYGFANGDPVNATDPFGLCPIEKDGIPCFVTFAAAGALADAAAAGIAGAAGGTLVEPGGGTLVGGAGGLVAGGSYGLVSGAMVGVARDATSIVSAVDWHGVKDKIIRGVSGIAVLGGLIVGGQAGDWAKAWEQAQKARAAQELRDKKQDEERRNKEREKDERGAGSAGGGDGG